MTAKDKPPIEVTLEKSSSGTWNMPGYTRSRIKPWQRLWLVAGLSYIFMLAGSYYLLIPTQEGIEQRMVFSVTEEVRRFDGMAFAGESPRKIFEIARSQGYDFWIAQIRSKYHIGPAGDPDFARIDNEYRIAVTELPMKQTLGILLCVVAWVVPMAVLYAIGFVVDWIRQGVNNIRQ